MIWVWWSDDDLERGKAEDSSLATSVGARLCGVGGLLLSCSGDGWFLVERLGDIGLRRQQWVGDGRWFRGAVGCGGGGDGRE